MHYIQANTQGRLHPATEPSLSPLNRGFLYGDAIYEVWRTYEGVIFAWEEHWQRLERSARSLYLDFRLTQAEVLQEIHRTVQAFRAVHTAPCELYIRLQVTRGAGAIGLDPALADAAVYVILVQPLSGTAKSAGLRLSLATTLHRNDRGTLDPAWKTGNYLNNILCLREARARGADEVVITNLHGEITEAAVCNLGFVRGREILTPPLSSGLLAGVTRQLLFSDVAALAGLTIREAVLRPDDLSSLDEAFVLSTTRDVAPVSAIDAHAYPVGDQTITAALKRAFADYVRRYVERHRRELSVP